MNVNTNFQEYAVVVFGEVLKHNSDSVLTMHDSDKRSLQQGFKAILVKPYLKSTPNYL